MNPFAEMIIETVRETLAAAAALALIGGAIYAIGKIIDEVSDIHNNRTN